MPDTVVGLPAGLLLIPAREHYNWERLNKIQIRVPNKGQVSELITPEERTQGLEIPGPDEFTLLEDQVFLLWEVVRVLFASNQYPNLEDDQCLSVTALEVDGDDIIVHGEIIRSVS